VTAARLAGVLDVHSQLLHLDLLARGGLRRRVGVARRVLLHLVMDTHPPTPGRAATVAAYDGVEDPDVAARRMCSERGLLDHRGWALRWLWRQWNSYVPALDPADWMMPSPGPETS
jgi:hypothetical protein